jgi:hypothetical protein
LRGRAGARLLLVGLGMLWNERVLDARLDARRGIGACIPFYRARFGIELIASTARTIRRARVSGALAPSIDSTCSR